MACGSGRLGTVLKPNDDDYASREAELLGVLEALAGTNGARGQERGAAEAIRDHAARRWPHVQWSVDAVGDPAGPCAQLVAACGEPTGSGDLLLYSHLDTSLSGDPGLDHAVTGLTVAPAPYRVDPEARTVRGPGLGVARAPAAAALVAFARVAYRLRDEPRRFGVRLLLAARGTHRAGDWELPMPVPTGVASYLARHGAPAAAVVAKGGPAAVLYDEPGACYLRVRLRAAWGAIMARDRLRPEGGLLAHLGVLVDAVERSGSQLVAGAPTSAQAGAQFGIGAVRSGLPGKPDLAPGVVDVYCYLVTPGPLVSGDTARVLADRLQSELAGSVLEGLEITVTDQVIDSGAGTDPGAAVVRAATRAYREELGAPPADVTGWTGSTDGVVLRAAGVPTARVGPNRTRPCGDGSDLVDLDELLACSRMYERIALLLAESA